MLTISRCCVSLRAYLSNERHAGRRSPPRCVLRGTFSARPARCRDTRRRNDTAVGVSVLKAMDDMASRPAVVLLMADEDRSRGCALQRGCRGSCSSPPDPRARRGDPLAAKGQLWMSPRSDRAPPPRPRQHNRGEGSTGTAHKREFDVLNLLIEGFHQSESRGGSSSREHCADHSQNLQRKLGVTPPLRRLGRLDAGLRPAA